MQGNQTTIVYGRHGLVDLLIAGYTHTMLNRKKIMFFLALLSLLQVSCSSHSTQQGDKATPKNLQLDFFVKQAPSKVCGNEKYLGCLGVSYDHCAKEVSIYAAECKNQMIPNMPDLITSSDETKTYGRQFGDCIVMRQITYGDYIADDLQACLKR